MDPQGSATNPPPPAQPPTDPITEHVPQFINLPAPNIEEADYFQLLWALFRTMLLWFLSITAASQCTATATEKIRTNIEMFTAMEPKLDVTSPEKFTGTPEKVEGFLNALIFYFKGKRVTSDEAKIIYALSIITGGTNNIAGNWADLQRQLIIEDAADAPYDWEKFETAFVAYFKYSSTKDELQTKLTKLVQGKGTADEYITQFKGIMKGTGSDDEALLYWFKMGLNDGLRASVWSLRPSPTNLSEWMKEASNQDRHYRQNREYQSHKHGSTGQSEKTSKPPANNNTPSAPAKPAEPQGTTPDPNAMDIDAMKKKGLCYKCKKFGHRFFECPEGKGKEKDRFNVREMSKDDKKDLLKELLNEDF